MILSSASIYAEAGEIFAGVEPAAAGEMTVFKSVEGRSCRSPSSATLVDAEQPPARSSVGGIMKSMEAGQR